MKAYKWQKRWGEISAYTVILIWNYIISENICISPKTPVIQEFRQVQCSNKDNVDRITPALEFSSTCTPEVPAH